MPSAQPFPPSSPPPQPTPTHPDIPPFPSASTFSILPDLYILLARLAPLRQSATTLTTNGGTAIDPSTNNHLTTTLSNEPAVEVKDLPTLTYAIKQKIVRAKAAVQSLPDIERSIAEQEEEMRVLEGRVRGLRGRLGELGEIAGRAKEEPAVVGGKTGQDGDGEGFVVMEGVGGG